MAYIELTSDLFSTQNHPLYDEDSKLADNETETLMIKSWILNVAQSYQTKLKHFRKTLMTKNELINYVKSRMDDSTLHDYVNQVANEYGDEFTSTFKFSGTHGGIDDTYTRCSEAWSNVKNLVNYYDEKQDEQTVQVATAC